jgi:hypothetical protein
MSSKGRKGKSGSKAPRDADTNNGEELKAQKTRPWKEGQRVARTVAQSVIGRVVGVVEDPKRSIKLKVHWEVSKTEEVIAPMRLSLMLTAAEEIAEKQELEKREREHQSALKEQEENELQAKSKKRNSAAGEYFFVILWCVFH